MFALTRLPAFGTVAVGVATALSYAGRWFWIGDLLVTFRTHFAGLSCLLLIGALAMRRWTFAAVALAALVLNAWPLSVMFTPLEEPVVEDARPVRVVAFNVHIRNADYPRVATYLDGLSPDVVILEEVPAFVGEELRRRLPSLPHYEWSENTGLGVAILSRWQLRDTERVVRDDVTLALRADVDFGDRRLRVYGIHLYWPLVPASAKYRDAQLAGLGRELAQCRGPCMVAGDFNITPWSSHFRDMIETSGFRDCARGRGWLPTWNAWLPSILRIRIDHCLANDAVAISSVTVGDSAGSDHFVTINDLLIGRP